MLVGKKVGTRKAFPDISPGKTVAGTIACIVFAILRMQKNRKMFLLLLLKIVFILQKKKKTACLMMRESVRRGILPDYILPPK